MPRRLKRDAAVRAKGIAIIESVMPGLAPTPPERLVDAAGRPYFLWDVNLTIGELRRLLADPDEDVRAYWTGKILRQAKPDDVFQFVTRRTIESLWPRLERYLGTSKPFWEWILKSWNEIEERLG